MHALTHYWRIGMQLAAAMMLALSCLNPLAAADHLPLAKDGLHDPNNPGIKYLQEPEEALSNLPPDEVGNRVRWVKALEQRAITPRTNILQNTRIYTLNLDVLLPYTGEMPMVLFPHKQHTEWLDCTNCHEHLFKYKANTTKGLNMFNVLQGEFCGRCHGAVAFPLTECRRCHSVERK
ncbi:c(7)-type cytochrome triheme domain-containing protein [Noviherbaspirillum sp. UKPF54]|uniref:c(7)-type cytochrome triheme domain-containing protein n=1 Tax=Noviherbaspirillum sp. UKPF54 TaxID=2601898 RepID=UPI0011B16750|nr:c(7)-type cytochrome triheme domain-containing protein [Noviherbaspirillum sp. UKPF54]QDZ27716.1 hypothetical protein FAY22_06950 [Noviherbaspirillum sp. UKPF54]